MIHLTRAVPLAALATAVLLSAACKKTPETVPTPTGPVVMANQDSIDRARRESEARAEAARMQAERDRIARMRADSLASAERMMRDNLASLTNSLLAHVHYNYDQSDILDQDKAQLDRKAQIMAANTGVRLRIAGHADERGSDEYNMALSQRRAASAKRYLESRGVSSDRIEIISLGEERPICEGHEESCWAQNRRAEFEIIAGGGNLMMPR